MPMRILPFNAKPAVIEEPWLDPKTLAQILGFKDGRTVRRMARRGQIPYIAMKNGGATYMRFKRSDVLKALTPQPDESAENDEATG